MWFFNRIYINNEKLEECDVVNDNVYILHIKLLFIWFLVILDNKKLEKNDMTDNDVYILPVERYGI